MIDDTLLLHDNFSDYSIVGYRMREKIADKRIRVLFYIDALSGGGAEMHFIRILSCLDCRKYDPILVVGRSGGAFDDLIGKVNAIVLEKKGLWSVVTALRRVIDQQHPDIIFSIMDRANVCCLLASRLSGARPKTVIGVQIPPSVEYRGPWWSRRAILLRLIELLYPQADCIVALSEGVRKDLTSINSKLSDLCKVVFNAGVDDRVVESAVRSAVQPPIGESLLVACGRLTKQKGFPVLLDAMALVRARIPAQLWIVGEGEDRNLLEQQIHQLGLTECVRLLGFQRDPFQFMVAADVFVLSSLWEGFGNVIVEAMACGTAVVSTDCPYGPSEIITDGEDGILVPTANPQALAEQILRVLADDQLRRRLAESGQRRSSDFSADRIARCYEDLFLRTVGTLPQQRAA